MNQPTGGFTTFSAFSLDTLKPAEDLPMVIEIVDNRDKIDLLLPFLDEAVTEGLVTLETVEVVQYRAGRTPDGGTGK